MQRFRQASERAARRKSPWNLFLLVLVVVALAGSVTAANSALIALHQVFHPGQTLRGATGPGPGITLIAAFIGCVPIAMLAANAVVRLIPPARSALDTEAAGHAGTDFRSSQRGLLRIAAIIVPLALAAAVAGAAMSW
jgi:hypothetical protein